MALLHTQICLKILVGSSFAFCIHLVALYYMSIPYFNHFLQVGKRVKPYVQRIGFVEVHKINICAL